MRIIIVQAEIEAAIRAYILNQIAVKDGQDIKIEFKNTRGDDGATAEISINPVVGNGTQSNPLVADISSSGSQTQTITQAPSMVSTAEPVAEPTVIEQLAVANVVEAREDPNPSTTAVQDAAAGNTQATTEASPVEPASSTSDQTTSSEPDAGDDVIVRTVPFDEADPVSTPITDEAQIDPIVKPSLFKVPGKAAPAAATEKKSLFGTLLPPVNKKAE